MSQFYNELKQSLDEAIAFEKGDTSKATVHVYNVPHYKAQDVLRVRKQLDITRQKMAIMLGVSLRAVETWETGRAIPNECAQRLLYIIEKDPTAFDVFTTPVEK